MPSNLGSLQLHQLRGRVGRSDLLSLCIAMHRHELTDSGMARLQAFATTADGFELAEADLRLRKEGDVLGAGQSGTATHLRFLSVRRDEALIRASKSEAEALLAQDPDPVGPPRPRPRPAGRLGRATRMDAALLALPVG